MMVSMLSLSPFTLLPFFKINFSKKDIKQFFLIILIFWIFLWTLSIPYTRVAIACSISLVIFAFSEPINNLSKPNKNNSIKIIKSDNNLWIINYLSFSIWTFQHYGIYNNKAY